MPNTKRQHFVPRVYLKAWELPVETKERPFDKFLGVYAFSGSERIGDGRTRDSILWQPHLYTVGFDKLFISETCPEIYADFVDKVYNILQVRQVYGRMGYIEIKTKSSVRKHLKDVSQWDFIRSNGTRASKKAILNEINMLKSFIIEDGLGSEFENSWESTLDSFLGQMKSDASGIPGKNERVIDKSTAVDMLTFFFMMLCRSPKFDGDGLYQWLEDGLLTSMFGDNSHDFVEALWYSELYKIVYHKNGGFFHSYLLRAMEQCQMTLFETYPDAGEFITSDNPAFQYINVLELNNANGFYFPLSPTHLLFICRGEGEINEVGYRFANWDVIKQLNQRIYSKKFNTVIGRKKELSYFLH